MIGSPRVRCITCGTERPSGFAGPMARQRIISAICNHCNRTTNHLNLDHPDNHQETTTMSTTINTTQTDDPTLAHWEIPTTWSDVELATFIDGVADDITTIQHACHTEASERGHCSDYDDIVERVNRRLHWPWLSRRNYERTIRITITEPVGGIGLDRDGQELAQERLLTLRRNGIASLSQATQYETADVTPPPPSPIDQWPSDWKELGTEDLRLRAAQVATDARFIVGRIRAFGVDRDTTFYGGVVERIQSDYNLTAPWFPEMKAPTKRRVTVTVVLDVDSSDPGSVGSYRQAVEEQVITAMPASSIVTVTAGEGTP